MKRTPEQIVEIIKEIDKELIILKSEDDTLGVSKGFYNRRRRIGKLSRQRTLLFTRNDVLSYIRENKIKFTKYKENWEKE